MPRTFQSLHLISLDSWSSQKNVKWPCVDILGSHNVVANWHPRYKLASAPHLIDKLFWPKISWLQNCWVPVLSVSSGKHKKPLPVFHCHYEIAIVQILNTDHKKLWRGRKGGSILQQQWVVWWLWPRLKVSWGWAPYNQYIPRSRLAVTENSWEHQLLHKLSTECCIFWLLFPLLCC